MSNELAIASVTAALSELLRPAVQAQVQGAEISMVRPDELANLSTPGVNLFLYQVSPNPAFRNADLPLRSALDGRLVERPQAALDLQYLLTFYGDEARLEPQRIMGCVVRVLHSRPVLTPELIRDTLGSSSFSFLAGSDLAEQVERVKFTPVALGLEELSKGWSMFSPTAYRLSMTYVASLVLIETGEMPRQGLPVQTRNIYPRPLRQPVIDKVATTDLGTAPITGASTLVIEGRCLRGDITRVQIGAARYAPAGATLGDTRIQIDLGTETPVGGALRAGLQGLQVVHRLPMGTPPAAHEGVESNVMPVLLRPTIRQSAPPAYDIQLSPAQTDANGNVFRTVTATLDPQMGARQRVVLILNEFGNSTDPAGCSFPADLRTAAGHIVTFTIPDAVLHSGDYIVRVQVDGAQSVAVRDPVAVDPVTSAPNPTFNQYIAPRLAFS